jgi:hypothetical protein
MDPLVVQILNVIITAFAAIVTVAAPVVATYIVTLLKKKIAQVEGQIPAERLEFVKALCVEAVRAAEVAGANTFIASKEDYAIKYAQDYLDSKGISFNVANLEGLIKSAFLTAISSTGDTLPAIKAPTPGSSAPAVG